jgi:hypothetical protein
MLLNPSLPPGRRDRKALAFSAEIHRLRLAGYSFEAVRLALLDAGVVVSRTTVKREAAKPLALPLAAPSSALPNASHPASSIPSTAPAPIPSAHTRQPIAGHPLRGRDIADEFFKGRISNPLLNQKDPP